jgi:hypothetical protein
MMKIVYYADNIMCECMRKTCGDRIVDWVSDLCYWAAFKPNPLVQIFYGIIAIGGYYVYVKTAYFKYCPGPYIAAWNRWTGAILMFACYYSFYKACTVDPGIIHD